ncbi:hypothetical protein CCHL11_00327 [Colletotrichum chlorophyti]|uniref:LysM domain-containing protein n=1 Tax=Colletotrichum chlorophyti TaxID=708187 RepID=A0A1Q8RUS5_9PEZI|nr:hypothetical protein CCHL11_00327 [Colletotrichum chlorophyti]
MRSSVILSLAALAGLAVAKRDCRRDKANPGKGWYWIVSGDTLNSIASDFDTTADELAKLNSIPDKDFIEAWTTIVVPCKP